MEELHCLTLKDMLLKSLYRLVMFLKKSGTNFMVKVKFLTPFFITRISNPLNARRDTLLTNELVEKGKTNC